MAARPRRRSQSGATPVAGGSRNTTWGTAMNIAKRMHADSTGFNYDLVLENELARLKRQGLYRDFTVVSHRAGSFPEAIHHSARGDHTVMMWCSLDFMGMGQERAVKE